MQTITTQPALRAAFWESHPNLHCRRSASGKPLEQNSQPADTRMAWVGYVDAQHRAGNISDALAKRATL